MANCCDPKAPKVKKIHVGGSMVGIVGLDLCLVEVKELGIDARIVKVDNLTQIMAKGIMSVPGLIINGKILSTGRVPNKREIKAWLEQFKK